MKKIYKIIASISVFLIVLFVGVVLVVGNTNKKANAGIIISASYAKINDRSMNKSQLNGLYISLDYAEFGSSKYMYYLCDVNTLGSSNAYFYLLFSGLRGDTGAPLIRISMGLTTKGRNAGLTSFDPTWVSCDKMEDTNYSIFLGVSVSETLQKFSDVNQTNADFLANNDFDLDRTTASSNSFFRQANIIENCTNLQDLKNNQLSIYYLQDLSNLSSTLTNEATINYGFIDDNDNTLYSVYTKYIQIAYDSTENTLTFDIPETNTNYIFSNTYDYDGQTFSAWSIDYDIYIIWVWHNNNTIKWGIGLCSHSPLYTNNMITNITEIYSLTASNSTTMTCRITDNENLNFITINNIDLTGDFPLSQVNQALRSGGIIPAYAYYQYVSGRNTGFSLGETSATRYWQDYYGSGGAGYNEIFQAGREAGLHENIGTQSWFIKIFEGVDSFLNIRIFPNITFGVLLGIPFIISVVWFIIRTFRGGGSS